MTVRTITVQTGLVWFVRGESSSFLLIRTFLLRDSCMALAGDSFVLFFFLLYLKERRSDEVNTEEKKKGYHLTDVQYLNLATRASGTDVIFGGLIPSLTTSPPR